MSKNFIFKLVLKTRIQEQSYQILRDLIQQAKYVNTIDLESALIMISQSEKVKDGDFITDENSFKDIVRILVILTKLQTKQVVDGILKYYKDKPEKYQYLDNMSQYLNFDPTPETSSEEQEPVVSPSVSRKVHIVKQKINPLDITQYYTKEKQYCQAAFSMPLLPGITYNPPQLSNEIQQNIKFTQKLIYLPEIKLLSVPNIMDIKISNQQMHINPYFQNESFDVPDIQCTEQPLHKIISHLPQSLDFPYNIKIITFKPVPQNHSLLDFTGVYGSPNEIKFSLLKQIKNDFKENLNKKLTIFEIFEKYLTHLYYFKPLNIVIDNRNSGNLSRSLRFGLSMHSDVSAYIFATYINGSLRFQANAAEDLAKDTEIALGIENSVFKIGSELFNFQILLNRYFYQMNRQIDKKAWESISDDKELNSVAQQAYLYQMHFLLGEKLLKEISIEELIKMIQNDFVGSEQDINQHEINESVLSVPYSPYYRAQEATFQMLSKLIEDEVQSQKIINILFDQLTENVNQRDNIGQDIYQIIQGNYQQQKQLTCQQYYNILYSLWLTKKYTDKQAQKLLEKAKIAFIKQNNQGQQIMQEYYQLTQQKELMEQTSTQFQEKQCQQFGDFLIQCIKNNPCYNQQFLKAKKYDTQTVQLQMAHVGFMSKGNYNNENYNLPDYYQQCNNNPNIKWVLQRIFKGAKETDNLEKQQSNICTIPPNKSAILQLANIQQNEEKYQELVNQSLERYKQYLQE